MSDQSEWVVMLTLHMNHIENCIRIEEYARNMQICIRYGLAQCDLVLADSGFIIEDSVGLYCAKVCIPFKGESNSPSMRWTGPVTCIRVHVARNVLMAN